MGVRGKRKRPTKRTIRAEVRWRGIVADQRSSGKGVDAFCRERGINKVMLYKWRKRFKIADAARDASATDSPAKPAVKATTQSMAKLVPVRVTSKARASSQEWGMEITFPAGHVLRVGRGISAEVITAVLATMRAVAC